MSTNMPKNWTQTPIRELIELAPKSSNSDDLEVGFVPMPLMGTGYCEPIRFEPKKWRDVKKGYTHFQDHDVLLAKITPCFENGKGGIARGLPNGSGAGSTEYFVCRPIETTLLPEYLHAFFKTPEFMSDGETQMTGSVGHKRVPKDFLLDTPIPLAPLAEQKRIADKLKTVLERVDACRTRIDCVPAILKRFRQSVLAAATSGTLTEEWRTSHKVALWSERLLGSLCEKGRIITYGVIKLGKETPMGVPCLRTSNVRWLNIDTTGMKCIEKSLSNEYSRTILKGGEVLVNVRGTLGGVAVTEQNMAGWNVSREVAVVPVDQSILLAKFLAFWIGTVSSQAWLTGVQKGVAYTGINIEDLRLLPIGIPSPAEQQEIVRRVEALFAMADRIEARLASAQKTVERLTPATLAKAFRGELVPQDPDDESSVELLLNQKVMRKGSSRTKSSQKKSP